MADAINPAATEHLPSFITAPGQTDVLMVIMSIIMVLAVLMFGVLFFRLHTLPERMAHKSQKLQFEIVAVLGLIALFTHMHIFWVIGLILALIDFPDFSTPLRRIALSTETLAGIKPSEEELSPGTDAGHRVAAAVMPEPVDGQQKGPSHA
jgi:multisubunit Na+/H+ antiporter MnhF subunit